VFTAVFWRSPAQQTRKIDVNRDLPMQPSKDSTNPAQAEFDDLQARRIRLRMRLTVWALAMSIIGAFICWILATSA
jgi:hypothetical protein